MVVIYFKINGTTRKVVIGNITCRTEASNRVKEAFPGCEITSTSTSLPALMYELTRIEE